MLLRGLRVAACAALVLAPLQLRGQNSTRRAADPLQLQNPAEHQIGPGETDEYTIQAKAGDFVRVEARQMGVDVAVVVVNPSGKTLLEADRPNGQFGPESASFIADAAGEFHIRIVSGSPAAGRYRIELLEVHEPREQDRKRIAAEAAEFQAVRESGAGTREATLHTIELLQTAGAMWRELKDPYEESLCWNVIGNQYSALGEKQKALDYFNQALPVSRAANDASSQADNLNSIATVYNDLGDKQKALDYFNQALPLFRAAGDRSGEATDLNNLGFTYDSLGDKRGALDYFERALTIHRATGNRSGEAITLTNIGFNYDSTGRKQEALDYYQQALTIFHETKDTTEATVLNNIGTVYKSLGEMQKALDYYGRALPLHRTSGNRMGEVQTLNNFGTVYDDFGERRKALDYYKEALPIARAIGYRAGEAALLTNAGKIHDGLGERRDAIDDFQQALPIWRAVGNRYEEATALNNIGAVYDSLGEARKALDYFAQALPLERATQNRSAEGLTLNNMARIYGPMGEKQKALEYLLQALPLERAVQNRNAEGIVLNNLGALYNDLGEIPKALEYYEQTLQLRRDIADRPGEGIALVNIGYVYLARGDPDQALDYFQQGLSIDREVGNRFGEGIALNNIGRAYEQMGETQKAMDAYNQSLPVARAVENLNGIAVTLNNLAYFKAAHSQTAAAHSDYIEALQLARTVSDAALQATILCNLMLYWRAENRPGLAIFFGKQSVNQDQDLRRNIGGLDQKLQRTYLATVTGTYRILADLLIGQGRLIEAQETLDLLKRQEFYDYAGSEEAAAQADSINLTRNEDDWAARYRKIGEPMAQNQAALAELRDRMKRQPALAGSADAQRQLSGLLTAIEDGNRNFQQFLSGLEQRFDQTAGAAPDSAGLGPKVSEIDPAALKNGAAAIYTLVSPERYEAILVTANAQKSFASNIKAADLNRLILEFRQAIEDRNSDPRPRARELYKILVPEGLAKALREAKAQTLLWSLDGPLRYVPLAALHDGKKYLIETFRIGILTPAGKPGAGDTPEPQWRILGMGVTGAHPGFAALPAVESELRGIVREKPGESGVIEGRRLLDGQFTRAAMEAELKNGYQAVHIASHFQFTPGDDNRSFLLLGDGAKLTLADIKSAGAIFQGVDLLTLSACSTGVGDVKMPDGSEVEGFGVLAQREGAKAVIASLWPVADTSTGALMRDFYRIRESDARLSKAEALRRAQLDLLNGESKNSAAAGERGVHVPGVEERRGSSRHPYYWAPFFLMGNWM